MATFGCQKLFENFDCCHSWICSMPTSFHVSPRTTCGHNQFWHQLLLRPSLGYISYVAQVAGMHIKCVAQVTSMI